MAPLPTKDDYITTIQPLLEPFECSICGDPFGPTHVPVKIPECSHIFGDHCIIEWFESENGSAHKCPICRRELFEAEYVDGEIVQEESEDEDVAFDSDAEAQAEREESLPLIDIERLEEDRRSPPMIDWEHLRHLPQENLGVGENIPSSGRRSALGNRSQPNEDESLSGHGSFPGKRSRQSRPAAEPRFSPYPRTRSTEQPPNNSSLFPERMPQNIRHGRDRVIEQTHVFHSHHYRRSRDGAPSRKPTASDVEMPRTNRRGRRLGLLEYRSSDQISDVDMPAHENNGISTYIHEGSSAAMSDLGEEDSDSRLNSPPPRSNEEAGNPDEEVELDAMDQDELPHESDEDEGDDLDSIEEDEPSESDSDDDRDLSGDFDPRNDRSEGMGWM